MVKTHAYYNLTIISDLEIVIRCENKILGDKMSNFLSNFFPYEPKMFGSLKEYTSLWEDLIFSYSFKHGDFADKFNLTLLQNETGFSLYLSFEGEKEKLTLKKFSLESESGLELQSLPLYDAAAVEIVLQGMDVLFFIADHLGEDEIQCALSKEDAENLLSFDSFFNTPSYQGAKVFMTLSASSGDYDLFIEEIEDFKTKLRKGLWKAQKEDLFLRGYLQNNTRSLQINTNNQKKETLEFNKDKVIGFPIAGKKSELKKVL